MLNDGRFLFFVEFFHLYKFIPHELPLKDRLVKTKSVGDGEHPH